MALPAKTLQLLAQQSAKRFHNILARIIFFKCKRRTSAPNSQLTKLKFDFCCFESFAWNGRPVHQTKFLLNVRHANNSNDREKYSIVYFSFNCFKQCNLQFYLYETTNFEICDRETIQSCTLHTRTRYFADLLHETFKCKNICNESSQLDTTYHLPTEQPAQKQGKHKQTHNICPAPSSNFAVFTRYRPWAGRESYGFPGNELFHGPHNPLPAPPPPFPLPPSL